MRDLHSFIEDVLADIEQQYDIQALRKQLAASEARPTRLFDSDTSDAYLAYITLATVQNLTSAAIEHDVQLYYGEVDPSKR